MNNFEIVKRFIKNRLQTVNQNENRLAYLSYRPFFDLNYRSRNQYRRKPNFILNRYFEKIRNRRISNFVQKSKFVMNLYHSKNSYRHHERNRERARNSYRQKSNSTQKSTRLRITNIMKFNSMKMSIVFFIKRFQHIIELEKNLLILRILSMCLKEIAFE